MEQKKWYKSKKLWYTIISGLTALSCKIYQMYNPEFDADNLIDKLNYLYVMLMGGHIASDISHNIKK